MDKDLLKLSIKNSNRQLFSLSQLAPILIAALMIVELVGTAMLCSYMDSTIGWNPGTVVVLVLLPCVLFIAGQLMYVAKVSAEYDKLKKEKEL